MPGAKLIPIVAGAGLVVFILYKVWALRLALQSRDWPTVTGRILLARIVPRGWRRDDDQTFAVEVRYQYTVDGRIYVGTKYSFDGNDFDEYGDAIDALAGIAVGREVTVYYDPNRPRRAVLRSGTELGPL